MICRSLQHLNQILLKYEQVPVECDGHTIIVSNLLSQLQIPYKRVYGEVVLSTGQVISPHFWITCRSYTIDYRLRMWGRFSFAAPETLPHGMFSADTIPPYVDYVKGGIAPAPLIDDGILDFMTDGYWKQIKADVGLN